MPKFAIFLPNLGPFADARLLGELAAEAEECGWDGFFIWDHVLFAPDSSFDVVDPWVALTSIGLSTQTIRLGALLTPLSRRRPWQVARQVASLDRLTSGRVTFAAGLGFPADAEFELFGEESDDRVRAARLDEGLSIVSGLLTGEQFEFSGEHFTVGPVRFTPKPVQERVPVWVAGWWPNKAPYRRAARWDGVVPELVGGAQPSVDDVRAISAYIAGQRTSTDPFDIVLNGYDVADQAAKPDYDEAGVTWWLERLDFDRGFSVPEARAIIARGPGR